MNDTPDVAGPRRYLILVDVRSDAVGPLFSLLIKEVEQPKLEAGEDGAHRMSLVCMQDQLPTITGIICEPALKLWIRPYVPEAKMGPANYRVPQQLAKVVTPLQREITVMHPRVTRVAGGAKAKDTTSGKIMMAIFKDGVRVKHSPDFADALAAAGFKASSAPGVLSRLVAEGDLVRIGQGAYRLAATWGGTTGDD